MAYDLKNVFYLDTSTTITKATAGGGSAQLDLSSYIDPIARGRAKGTGLAIYKVHYSIVNSEDSNEVAPKVTDEGVIAVSMQAGLGLETLQPVALPHHHQMLLQQVTTYLCLQVTFIRLVQQQLALQ